MITELRRRAHTGSRRLYLDVFADEAERQIFKTAELLRELEFDVPDVTTKKIYNRAIKRCMSSGEVAAKKAASKEYYVTQRDFASNLRSIHRFRGCVDCADVTLGWRSYLLPLWNFKVRKGRDGKIVANVLRANPPVTLDGAFFGMWGRGTRWGVFERVTEKRYPLVQLYGPSPTQMIYSNEAVSDEVEDKIVGILEKRMDHEIACVINGYTAQ